MMRWERYLMRLLIVAVCIGMQPWDAGANNISVANSVLWDHDASASNVYVEFDLSWENSWRTDVNRDAAWVFVKFRPEGSNEWQHATLSTNDSDHQAASGSTIDTPSDGKGAFIYSSGNGTGDVDYMRMRLRWNYGLDGYNFQKGDKVDISVDGRVWGGGGSVVVPSVVINHCSTGTSPVVAYISRADSTNPVPYWTILNGYRT